MEDFNKYAEGKNGGKNEGGGNGSLIGLIGKLASKYNGASESEIMAAIYEEAKRGRRNGTLSDADLDRFSAMLMPMLDFNKQKKLKQVIERLKKM